MKETVRSLMAYFILSGLLGGIQNLVALGRSESAIAKIIAVVGLCFAAAYVYAGVRLRPLLAKAPGRILTLLLAGAVFLAAFCGVALLYGRTATALPTTILGLLITWYLFVNVRRLSAESQPPAAAPVGS